MTLDTLRKELESVPTKEIKNGWSEKVTNGDKTYGLNISSIQKIAKDLDSDPILADEIYGEDNHDLKVLATFLDDPESYTLDEMSERVGQIYPSPFSNKFCENVVAKSSHAIHFINEWKNSKDAAKRNYAYTTLAAIAKQKNNLGVDFFVNQVESIKGSIKNEPRHVRKAMYKALMNIGCRDHFLKEAAEKAAQKIGLIRLNGNSTVDLLIQVQKASERRKLVFD